MRSYVSQRGESTRSRPGVLRGIQFRYRAARRLLLYSSVGAAALAEVRTSNSKSPSVFDFPREAAGQSNKARDTR